MISARNVSNVSNVSCVLVILAALWLPKPSTWPAPQIMETNHDRASVDVESIEVQFPIHKNQESSAFGVLTLRHEKVISVSDLGVRLSTSMGGGTFGSQNLGEHVKTNFICFRHVQLRLRRGNSKRGSPELSIMFQSWLIMTWFIYVRGLLDVCTVYSM